MPLLEAAKIIADPSLLHDLEEFSGPSENTMLDELVKDAIVACRGDSFTKVDEHRQKPISK